MSTRQEIDAALSDIYGRARLPLLEETMLSEVVKALNDLGLSTRSGLPWDYNRLRSYVFKSKRDVNAATRKARMEAAGGRHTDAEWAALLAEHDHCCAICGHAGTLEKDHIVPVYRGGSDDISNIRPLCKRCNCARGAKDVPIMKPEDIKRLRQDVGENAATFGQRFRRSGRTVEDWEQGRRKPDALVSTILLRLRRNLDTPSPKQASRTRTPRKDGAKHSA